MRASSLYAWKEPNIRCSICARRITLELSKTDEQGQAVHEECYVRRTVARSTMPIVQDRVSPKWTNALLEWARIAFPVSQV